MTASEKLHRTARVLYSAHPR